MSENFTDFQTRVIKELDGMAWSDRLTRERRRAILVERLAPDEKLKRQDCDFRKIIKTHVEEAHRSRGLADCVERNGDVGFFALHFINAMTKVAFIDEIRRRPAYILDEKNQSGILNALMALDTVTPKTLERALNEFYEKPGVDASERRETYYEMAYLTRALEEAQLSSGLVPRSESIWPDSYADGRPFNATMAHKFYTAIEKMVDEAYKQANSGQPSPLFKGVGPLLRRISKGPGLVTLKDAVRDDFARAVRAEAWQVSGLTRQGEEQATDILWSELEKLRQVNQSWAEQNKSAKGRAPH